MVPENNHHYKTALSLLNQISSTILDREQYQDTLDEIIERVTQNLDAWAGCLSVPDSDETFFHFVASYNRHPEILDRINSSEKLPVDESMEGLAYSRQEICAIPDIYENNPFQERFYQQAKQENIRAIIAVPLVVFENCIGVLTLYFTSKVDFNDEFFRIMGLVANQIAIAMKQSDLIEELQKSNHRLRKLAETDDLTGIPNHRKIQGTLRDEVNRSDRYEHPISLVMVDIDHFKQINDTYGHPFGDRVLKELAEIFQEKTRSIDTVGRYGGEEFLFVLPETNEMEAFTGAERVRKAVENYRFHYTDTQGDVTISTGISSGHGETIEANDLLKQADRALLEAKRTGRNQSIRHSQIDSPKPYVPPI